MEAVTTKAGSRIFLDICAGYQRPRSSSLKKFGCDVCTFDILVHSEDDLLNDNRYELLLRLACSRQVAYSAGSPSCNEYSRLKLRPGGRIALRTPDHLDGIPGFTYDQQLKVPNSATMLSRVAWPLPTFQEDIVIWNNLLMPWVGWNPQSNPIYPMCEYIVSR